MTQRDARCPNCGAPTEKLHDSANSATATKNEDREIDHRGVVMPRRTRSGGIIMPQ